MLVRDGGGVRPRSVGAASARRGGSHQYGSASLATASGFARRHLVRADLDHDDLRVSQGIFEQMRGAMNLAALLYRLPWLEVRLTGSASGRAIRGYLNERSRGIYHRRVAQGVLSIPPHPGDYLRGRSRQAVRTNLHRAARAGLQAREIRRTAERRKIVEVWARDASGAEYWAPKLLARAGDRFWTATDGDGRLVGLLAATVDEDWAMLHALLCIRSEARYLLHTALVTHLCEQRVSHLFATDGNALLMPPGLQYFQRLLGYDVAHLHPQGESRLTGPRRQLVRVT